MNLKSYFELMDKEIKKIMTRPTLHNFTYDILDNKNSTLKLLILQEKQKQMKYGEIYQVAIGNYGEFINLGKNPKSKLDIISYTKKIIIELKSRTNTDNSSSKKANLDKLANFKSENPDYECIYACINDSTEEKTKKGLHKIIKHNGVDITIYTGYLFLEFIFEENTEIVLEFLRNTIYSFQTLDDC